MKDNVIYINNSECVSVADLPALDFDLFCEEIFSRVSANARVVSWFGIPSENNNVRLFAVIANDVAGNLVLLNTRVKDSYPSLTLKCPQLHLFEREFFEKWGIRPEGHPWLKPVRFIEKTKNGDDLRAPLLTPYQLSGEEVHEVAVGPVHAGIIEPGHFRFQCHGETVYHLEISLGYQHRGIENAVIGTSRRKRNHYIETASGDTTVGHMLAYSQLMESLSGVTVSQEAETMRAIALEIERLACHTGDLGALAGDVGYLPTSSFCGRLRGNFLNMTALLCGNRFGRGLLRPGGVNFDLNKERLLLLNKRLEQTFSETLHAVDLLWDTPSVSSRFENTGIISKQEAVDLGLVGPACRACGIERDVRFNFSQGSYNINKIPPATQDSGDVFARAYVRRLEIQQSYDFLKKLLELPLVNNLSVAAGDIRADRIAVSLVEAWRGEVCHVAVTGKDGEFLSYKITDPSFHNWTGLALALREEEISDFPLCNKSFNLSYCGHDL